MARYKGLVMKYARGVYGGQFLNIFGKNGYKIISALCATENGGQKNWPKGGH